MADVRGTAAIELALTLPLLMTLIFGIVAYGDWFLAAHNVQQAANDAARATMSGLNSTERATIAMTTVQTSLKRGGTIDPSKVSVLVDDDGATLVVRLAYDASGDPVLSMKMLPVPSTMIQRSAAIRLDSI